MDDNTQGTLSDEDIKTILPVGGVATTLETDPGTKDADGTDGDTTDGTDGDGSDGRTARTAPTRTGTDGDSSATA